MTDVPVAAPEAPIHGVAEWAAYQHFQEILELLRKLTPLNWTAHADPEREGTYYIGGPPDTEIIAEGLTAENAEGIVGLVNDLPEAIEYFEDLAKLWDVAVDLGGSDDVVDNDTLFSTISEVVNKYQLRIAQAEANPQPVPLADTAGDLNYMHIGHLVTIPSAGLTSIPVVGVYRSADFVKLNVAFPKDMEILLPPDTPVAVALIGQLTNLYTGDESPETPPLPAADVAE